MGSEHPPPHPGRAQHDPSAPATRKDTALPPRMAGRRDGTRAPAEEAAAASAAAAAAVPSFLPPPEAAMDRQSVPYSGRCRSKRSLTDGIALPSVEPRARCIIFCLRCR